MLFVWGSEHKSCNLKTLKLNKLPIPTEYLRESHAEMWQVGLLTSRFNSLDCQNVLRENTESEKFWMY